MSNLLQDLLERAGSLVTLFQEADADKSGTVDKVEFHHALELLGFNGTPADSAAIFDSLDDDKSGQLEYMELKERLRAGDHEAVFVSDSLGFDFQHGQESYLQAMKQSGLGMLGYTGYEGSMEETDDFDIEDRLKDAKFLHAPFNERSPAGGFPMKHPVLGEYYPTMSSVIGKTTGYVCTYERDPKPTIEKRHVKAGVPDSAMDQWALSVMPESRNYGMFYKGKVAVEEPPKRIPPPTRYDSYTPNPKKPDPPMDCSTRPNRQGESLKKPDPAWGYTGHEFARRFDLGEESLSMASRIAARRKASIERRFNDSPQKNQLASASDLGSVGTGKTYEYGWASFPPNGLKGVGAEKLGLTGEDLHAAQIRGPNNAQISSAKLYANAKSD